MKENESCDFKELVLYGTDLVVNVMTESDVINTAGKTKFINGKPFIGTRRWSSPTFMLMRLSQ